MSSSSANATTLPDRRHFLSTVAAAGALGLPALPAFAAAAGPIERMHAEHVRLTAIEDAAMEATWDAEERYEEPDRPRWHPFYEEGGYVTITTRPGHGTPVLDNGAHNIAYLRELIAREDEPDEPDAVFSNQRRAQRARSTLARIEAWLAEVKCRADAAGLTDAREVEAQATATLKQNTARVFSIEPTTLRELAFRAAVLCMNWDQGEADDLPERLVALVGIEPHHLG